MRPFLDYIPTPHTVLKPPRNTQVIVSPCGFRLAQAVEQTKLLMQRPGFMDLPAAKQNRVFAVDANAHYSRSVDMIVVDVVDVVDTCLLACLLTTPHIHPFLTRSHIHPRTIGRGSAWWRASSSWPTSCTGPSSSPSMGRATRWSKSLCRARRRAGPPLPPRRWRRRSID